MRFTQYTDFSIRVLIYLSLKPDGARATIKEIAARYKISENHLMKVVHQLGLNGFVKTTRGRQGGIRLAKDPAHINIGDVVRQCEEDMRIVECFDARANTCPIAPVCAAPAILDEALGAFFGVLDGYSLADLLVPRKALMEILTPPV